MFITTNRNPNVREALKELHAQIAATPPQAHTKGVRVLCPTCGGSATRFYGRHSGRWGTCPSHTRCPIIWDPVASPAQADDRVDGGNIVGTEPADRGHGGTFGEDS